MGTHVTVMNQGEEIQTGSPKDLYDAPKTPFLASFIGETNLIKGIYKGKSGELHQIATDLGMIHSSKKTCDFSLEAKVCVSIRTESIQVRKGQEEFDKPSHNVFPTTLTHSTYLGELEQLKLQCQKSKHHIHASVFNAKHREFAIGSRVHCCVDPQYVGVLPPQ